MRSKSEIREFASVIFMLGQIETKANEDWVNDFAISIRNYVVDLFNEGMPDDTTKIIGEDGIVFFEQKAGEADEHD